MGLVTSDCCREDTTFASFGDIGDGMVVSVAELDSAWTSSASAVVSVVGFVDVDVEAWIAGEGQRSSSPQPLISLSSGG